MISFPTQVTGPMDSLSIAERRSRRIIVLPKRYKDILPEPCPSLPHEYTQPQSECLPQTSSSHTTPFLPHEHTWPSSPSRVLASSGPVVLPYQTPWNIFGLARKYSGTEPPSHDPENFVTLNELSELKEPTDEVVHMEDMASPSPYFPYPNKNSFLLGDWYWNNGVQKSQKNFQKLIGIVGDPDFSPSDICNTRWNKINHILGHSESDGGEWEWEDEDAGWQKTEVTISVPFSRNACYPGPKNYTVTNFFHRSLLGIVREKLSNAVDDEKFHYEPFELHWRSPLAHAKLQGRVYSELYTSLEFMKAHQTLQESPPEPGCHLPRVVLALMFWSDGTCLTAFGKSKLWPLYMMFGNESKYRRCKPSSHLFNHVAYFEEVKSLLQLKEAIMFMMFKLQLPDEFKDFASVYSGKCPSDVLFTHCRRELFHAQWKILLDDEFIEAYHHGLVINCCDGFQRRFYPRIFTYSADYPEKYVSLT